ncbi:hypothetical protein QF049_004028 [Paenibacillus sp. W4I10]|nr:hypothetical protein [Paenibacillus sp. W4I10]
MPLNMKFRIEKLGSKMLVQVVDRGKTPRSQHSEKGVFCMACNDKSNVAFKNSASANGDLHLPTNRQALLESDSDCFRRCFASFLV